MSMKQDEYLWSGINFIDSFGTPLDNLLATIYCTVTTVQHKKAIYVILRDSYESHIKPAIQVGSFN